MAAGPGGYSLTQQAAQPVVAGVATLNGRTTAGTIAAVASGSATPVGTLPSAVTGIALPAGADSVAHLFAEILPVGLAGVVFIDLNNNGLQDLPADVGLGGVAIQISGTDDTGASVSRSLNTDSDGRYSVTDLRPGTYSVTQPNQPPGTSNGQTVPGSRGGSATPVATLPSAISAIDLSAPGTQSSANNFAEIPNSSGISGRVWLDGNHNGVIDAGEVGLAGVPIELSGTDTAGQSLSRSSVTDAQGNYSFDSLPPGSFRVTEPTQPAGTFNGRTVAGSSGGTATDLATLPSAISAIPLAVGQLSVSNNFGEIAPDLRVSKSREPAILTVNNSASWRISVRNVGAAATVGSYEVSDRLPTGVTLLATPSGNGWVCSGAAGASVFSCASSSVLGAQTSSSDPITALVQVGAAAAAASPVNNAVLVDGGGEIEAHRPSATERDGFANNPAALPQCDAAQPQHNVCRDEALVQLSAALSGTVWFDTGGVSRQLDGGDRRLPGWLVEVVSVASGAVVARASTAADGSYRIPDLTPGVELAVRFRDPASQVVFGYPVNGEAGPGTSGATCRTTPVAGSASSCVGSGARSHLTVVLAPGEELRQQSLPVDPSGVVYDSGLRQPVPGAVVTLAPVGVCAGWNPADHIVGATLGGYSISADAISMTVGPDGLYQFYITPSAPPVCVFELRVAPPPTHRFVSSAIAPTPGPLLPPGNPGEVYSVQPQAGAPHGPVGAATRYFLTVQTGSAGVGIIHNHIPLDPQLPGALALSKTGDKSVAEVGDSVRYTITVQAQNGPGPRQTTVVDRLPAGFTFIPGTAMVGDVVIADPVGGVGPTLAFHLGPMPASNQLVLRYRVRVGVGAMQGDGINRALAHGCGAPSGCVGPNFAPLPGSVPSNEARYRVRVTGGVFAPEACVLGKIFVDCNNNHVQDREELGVPGVRLVFSEGTQLISDSEGKYSVCGLAPRSHVLRADPATLPRGARLTTSSNRNLGDGGSLWLDLKNGELHRADFIEGSCSNTVLEQVRARRAQGEVRAAEREQPGAPALRFDSKAHGLDTLSAPQQGTDGANQWAPRPRTPAPGSPAQPAGRGDESHLPTPDLPMNQPPPPGRPLNTAPVMTAPGASNEAR